MLFCKAVQRRVQDGAGDEGCMMEMDDDAVHYFSQSFHSAQSDLEIDLPVDQGWQTTCDGTMYGRAVSGMLFCKAVQRRVQDGAGDEGCMMEMDDDAVHYFSQSFHSAQSDLEIDLPVDQGWQTTCDGTMYGRLAGRCPECYFAKQCKGGCKMVQVMRGA